MRNIATAKQKYEQTTDQANLCFCYEITAMELYLCVSMLERLILLSFDPLIIANNITAHTFL